MISKKKAIIYGVLLVVITFLITSTLNIALGGKVVISKETYEAYKKYNANQLFRKGNLDKVSIDIADKEATVLWTDCKYIIFPQPNVGANEPVIELLNPETLAIKLLAHIIPPFKYGFQTICDEQKYYETILELIDKIKRDVKGFNFFWTEDHDMNERFLRKFINV